MQVWTNSLFYSSQEMITTNVQRNAFKSKVPHLVITASSQDWGGRVPHKFASQVGWGNEMSERGVVSRNQFFILKRQPANTFKIVM